MTATPRYFTGRVLKAAQEADFESPRWTTKPSSARCFTA